MYKSVRGPDYHSVWGMWATVSPVFTYRPPPSSFPLSPSPSSIFLHTHKNPCQVHMLHVLSAANQSQVRPDERVHISGILLTSVRCAACPHRLHPCMTVKRCGEREQLELVTVHCLFCCQRAWHVGGGAVGPNLSNCGPRCFGRRENCFVPAVPTWYYWNGRLVSAHKWQ